ncbi:hypothetical protein SU69_01735 [Thermosipho melanesiensis]|uniref:DUF3307 domain-containing protein n=2 Tax=Thermosipho melanesiensis TaxID=46541 RepID=A6LJV2_THEM4|nr:DUF3307 domain-containing protein [Thermosipho melanesiensis]ABR30203.1 hypothetical protein Tmel_0333 [Thermosipho melanesiensis BI429]APT73401.1 hypothetical protein BW47_01790 [Thermosipho melanesiensis]OOC38215.1 hypothetical protein SU68_01745 [Thermosipho melanesiensis]OOC40044.1 hypothetical protein SU69_01735 [Thermosipho melanesiensis]OOC40064.1 hypothetical protein SU70_01730 [Thermosipho melanesiensis]
MDKFIHLFLGHLFGDYVFQTKWIATKKQKEIKVLLVHILIIFLSQVFFYLGRGFNLKILFCLLILSTVHFFIDLIKFINNEKTFFKSHTYYLIDQLLHFISLFIVTTFIPPNSFFFPKKLSVILISAVFNAYFLGIYSFFLKNNKIYQRDLLGYIIRGSFPIFYLFGLTTYSIYTLVTGVYSIYFLKKHQVISWALSTIFTMIFLEVML